VFLFQRLLREDVEFTLEIVRKFFLFADCDLTSKVLVGDSDDVVEKKR